MNPNEEDDQSLKTMTTHDLVAFLKTTFLKSHFIQVADILVGRENEYRKQIQDSRQENHVLSEKLAFEKLKVSGTGKNVGKGSVTEDELNRVKSERDALELELDVWKKRFQELDARILKMEVEHQLLSTSSMPENPKAGAGREDQTRPGGGPSDLGKVALAKEVKQEIVQDMEAAPTATSGTICGTNPSTGPTVTPVTQLKVSKMSDKSKVKAEAETQPAGGIWKDNGIGTTPIGATCGKNVSSSNPSSGKFLDVDLIEIDDHCSPVGLLSDIKSTAEGCSKGKRLELLNDVVGRLALKRKRASSISSSSDDTSSSTDSDSEKNSAKKEPFVKMLFEIQKNDELAMKSVCALYKQHTSSRKSAWGFKDTDVQRGNILGKFLTNGNPEGKLCKSVSELRNYDPSAIDECKKITVSHCSQLLEIHKNNEYPLFD